MLQHQTKIQNELYVHKRKKHYLIFQKNKEEKNMWPVDCAIDEPIRRNISGSEITEFECGGSLIFR